MAVVMANLSLTSAIAMSKVSHAWHDLLCDEKCVDKLLEEQQEFRKQNGGCSYCRSHDDDAQIVVTNMQGDIVDTGVFEQPDDEGLFTMFELTRGGGCRRLPPLLYDERGCCTNKRAHKHWDFGGVCNIYMHPSCLREHAADRHPNKPYTCVICQNEIWRRQSTSRRGRQSNHWQPVLAKEVAGAVVTE